MESKPRSILSNTDKQEKAEPRIPGHHLVTMETTAFADAVKSDFNLEVTNLEKITSGYSSQVYKATLDGKDVFIRINKNPEVFEVERVGYEVFRQSGIPAPQVIAYQGTPATIGHPTIILSAAEGVEISLAHLSPTQEAAAYEHVGELMRKMHSVTLEGYGTLEGREGGLRGKSETWAEYWVELEGHFSRDAKVIKSNALLTDEESRKLDEVRQELKSLDFGRASLLHLDVHGAHIFVTGDKVTGIIDLGRLTAGDPRYDIAMSLLFQTPTQQESFKKGYGELANDPVVTKYILSIAGTKIAFRFGVGNKKGVDAATATFRETLERL